MLESVKQHRISKNRIRFQEGTTLPFKKYSVARFSSRITNMSSANQAALYDARRRTTGSGPQALQNIVQGSNCEHACIDQLFDFAAQTDRHCDLVDKDEIDRLRKRFMKLDKVTVLRPRARKPCAD